MSERIEEQVGCPACGASQGEDCFTPLGGEDMAWTHDARILFALALDYRLAPTVPATTAEEEIDRG